MKAVPPPQASLPVTTGYVCVPDTLLPSSGLVDADRLDLTSSSPGVRAGREYSFPWEKREKRQLSIDVHTRRKGSGVQMGRRNGEPSQMGRKEMAGQREGSEGGWAQRGWRVLCGWGWT